MPLLPSRLLFCLGLITAAAAQAGTYVLSIHESPARIQARDDAVLAPAYWREFAAFAEQIRKAGILRGGSAFDATQASKRVRNGRATSEVETPASTSSETVYGGFFIIEVSNEAEALAWAAKAHAPGGFTEVRAALPMQMHD